MMIKRILLGAALALCVAGGAFASDQPRTESPKWEQGYGHASIDGKYDGLVICVAEAPRLSTATTEVAAVILSKRTGPAMMAVGTHFENVEVAGFVLGAGHKGTAQA